MDSISFNRDAAVKKIREFVRAYASDLSVAHGFDHAERVCKLALFISEKEGGEPMVLEIAALLHDIGIVPLAALKRALMVGDSNREHSKPFKSSLESKILNDADVLERYGATWIARAFQRTSTFDKSLGIETVIDRYLKPSGRPRHTKTAQRIMEKRMAFQISFIKQFIDELELRS